VSIFSAAVVAVYLRKEINRFAQLVGVNGIGSHATFDLQTGITVEIDNVVNSSSIQAFSNG